MDTLAAMRLFVAAVNQGNFSEAGRQLGLTPSSVSRQIGALEDSLGVRLINRTTRRLSLTEGGRLYFDRAQRILADVDDAALAVSELQSVPRGTLKLNLPMAFGEMHIAPLLPRFLAENPELELDLTFTDEFVDVIQGGYDVTVRIGALRDSTLIARKLSESRRMIFGNPDYLAKHGTPAHPEELSRHNCLTYKYQPGSVQLWRLSGADGLIEVAVSGNFHCNNAVILAEAASQGLGLAMLSTWLVDAHVKAGRLVPLFTEFQVTPTGAQAGIFAVYPPNRHLSPKVRAFVDFLADNIEDTHL